MQKSIKILAFFDGKIFKINDNFFSKNTFNIEYKRIFNLISEKNIITFINAFNKALKNTEKYIELNYIVSYKEKIFPANIFLKKYKNFLKIKITELNYDLEIKDSFLHKLIFISRFKFVLGSVIPFIFSVLWTFLKYETVSFLFLFLIFISLVLLHIAANTFNDYFDWISGRDLKNLDYILESTGGSRAIEFKLLSLKTMYLISWVCTIAVLLIASYLIIHRGLEILLLGSIGFFCLYFYSAPPIHLASRKGLGELSHIFCLGPIITYGTSFTLIGHANIIDFVIGFPFGILITCCLIMNEYPDSKYDKLSNKNNLAVILSEKYIPYFISFLIFINYFIIIMLISLSYLNSVFYIVFLCVPYAIDLIYKSFLIKKDKLFISESCKKSFNLYIFFSALFIIAVILNLIPW